MEIIAAIDGDGHFMLAKIEDRVYVVEQVLKKIQDGDYYANLEAEIIEDYMALDEPGWMEYLGVFVQRGICEIVPMP